MSTYHRLQHFSIFMQFIKQVFNLSSHIFEERG